jgi:hypothetical protein
MAAYTTAAVLLSALSFLAYGAVCLTSKRMRGEFKRLGLERFTWTVGSLEILGAVGLLVGLREPFILLVSSGGLALLMLLGVVFRVRAGDSFGSCFPALFFMALNGGLFFAAL